MYLTPSLRKCTVSLVRSLQHTPLDSIPPLRGWHSIVCGAHISAFATSSKATVRKAQSRPSTARQKPSRPKGAPRQIARPDEDQAKDNSLDWGPENMKPSRALQDRLKGLKRPTSQLIDAVPDQHSPQSIDVPLQTPADISVDGAEAETLYLDSLKVGDLQIKSAEYSTSSVRLEQCPSPLYPEIAVIGRSNVGKSSLINMLTGRKELALVSKTPGKTRCINHFLMNKSWYLVDLPGYGFAKTSKENRLEWGSFTQQFFKKRENLINVLLLIDASVPTQNIDLGCAQWLFEHEVPFSLVFTKIDKRKKRCPSPQENIATFEKELSLVMGDLPMSLTTSATDNLGRRDLLIYLAQLRELNRRNQGVPA